MGRDIESNILIANFPGYLLSFIQVFDRFSDIFRPVVGLPCSLRQSELDSLTDKIAQRVSRDLDKAGYLVSDASAAPWFGLPGSAGRRGGCHGKYRRRIERCVGPQLPPCLWAQCWTGRPPKHPMAPDDTCRAEPMEFIGRLAALGACPRPRVN